MVSDESQAFYAEQAILVWIFAFVGLTATILGAKALNPHM
jgi:hypothetical protein